MSLDGIKFGFEKCQERESRTIILYVISVESDSSTLILDLVFEEMYPIGPILIMFETRGQPYQTLERSLLIYISA